MDPRVDHVPAGQQRRPLRAVQGAEQLQELVCAGAEEAQEERGGQSRGRSNSNRSTAAIHKTDGGSSRAWAPRTVGEQTGWT